MATQDQALFGVTCIHCGYDLRGLHSDGRCPECGEPIEDSCRSDLLRFADKAWRVRVMRGWHMIYWPVVATVVGAVLSGVALLLHALFLNQFLQFQSTCVSIMLFSVLFVLVLALIVLYPAGCWLAATPRHPETGMSYRGAGWVRWTGLLVVPVLGLWVSLHGISMGGLRAVSPHLVELATHAFLAFLCVHLVNLYQLEREYLERCRADDDTKVLERASRFLSRNRAFLKGVPALVLVLHWGGVALEFKAGGLGGMGPHLGYGSGVGTGLMTLLWIGTVEGTRTTWRAIKLESMKSSTGDDATADSAAENVPAS